MSSPRAGASARWRAGLALVAVAAAPTRVWAVPGKDMAGESQSVTPEVLDELAAEIARSMARMRIPQAPQPSFIGYKITEVEVIDVAATLGARLADKRRHFVNLEAHVHVGDHQLDNSNFVVPQADGTDGVADTQLPLDPSPAIARKAAWMATDAAYKEALEQLAAKLDNRRSGSGKGDGVASYTPAPPLVQEEAVAVPTLEGQPWLQERAQRVSRAFRGARHLRESRVAFTSFLERRWYLNSEGTSAHDTRRVSGVLLFASAQAEDGQELALYYTRYGHTARDLPGDKELLAAAERLSSQLRELRTAPLLDNYSGPVLFEGIGAADIVRHALAPHLGGTPLPEGLEAAQAKMFGGAFADRIGRRVLSRQLSVIDDPTAIRAHRQALIGAYRFDDEGVPAQRVEAITAGRLKTLLMSRTPSKYVSGSNGHARRRSPSGVFAGSATNLIVSSRGGLPRKRLVARLLDKVKTENLPYGLIIRLLDDPAVTAAPELSRREILQFIKNADPNRPPPALLASRVYPDGREELVRGAQLEEIPTLAWRNVLATGRQPTVFNYLASTRNYLFHKVSGSEWFVPSAGVESAIVTPDLLFAELDVVRSTAGRRSEPAIERWSP